MENKLPVEFKEKWIAALRSGEYEQGKGYLMQNNKYCCLGIACVVIGIEPAKLERYDKVDDEDGESADPYELISNMPYEYKKEIPELLCTENEVVTTLTYMNDGCGTWADKSQSFLQIADWIEKEL